MLILLTDPTSRPSSYPSVVPTTCPSINPTSPTSNPSVQPTYGQGVPTPLPSTLPSYSPTALPTAHPTAEPSANPTSNPSIVPTAVPTAGSLNIITITGLFLVAYPNALLSLNIRSSITPSALTILKSLFFCFDMTFPTIFTIYHRISSTTSTVWPMFKCKPRLV